jgi:hypothetical protein
MTIKKLKIKLKPFGLAKWNSSARKKRCDVSKGKHGPIWDALETVVSRSIALPSFVLNWDKFFLYMSSALLHTANNRKWIIRPFSFLTQILIAFFVRILVFFLLGNLLLGYSISIGKSPIVPLSTVFYFIFFLFFYFWVLMNKDDVDYFGFNLI